MPSGDTTGTTASRDSFIADSHERSYRKHLDAMITVADNAGFCFGVKRAVDTVFACADSRPDAAIYTVGELIHNPTVIRRLSEMGVHTIEEAEIDAMLGSAPPRSVFVIRTHGVPRLVK